MQCEFLLFLVLAFTDIGNPLQLNLPLRASRRFMFGRMQPFWKSIFPVRQTRFKRFRPDKPPPPLVMKRPPTVVYYHPPPPPVIAYSRPTRQEKQKPKMVGYGKPRGMSVYRLPPEEAGKGYRENSIRLEGFGPHKENQGNIRLSGFGRPRPYSIIQLPNKKKPKSQKIESPKKNVKKGASSPPKKMMAPPVAKKLKKKPVKAAMPMPPKYMRAPPPRASEKKPPPQKRPPTPAKPTPQQSTYASRRQPLSDLVVHPVPRVNAGVLPLANEKPHVPQIFPPYANT